MLKDHPHWPGAPDLLPIGWQNQIWGNTWMNSHSFVPGKGKKDPEAMKKHHRSKMFLACGGILGEKVGTQESSSPSENDRNPNPQVPHPEIDPLPNAGRSCLVVCGGFIQQKIKHQGPSLWASAQQGRTQARSGPGVCVSLNLGPLLDVPLHTSSGACVVYCPHPAVFVFLCEWNTAVVFPIRSQVDKLRSSMIFIFCAYPNWLSVHSSPCFGYPQTPAKARIGGGIGGPRPRRNWLLFIIYSEITFNIVNL